MDAQKTWVWTYDNAGNITSRSEYAYTFGELGAPLDTVVYGYSNADWGDLLTSYDGKTITYDQIGNPLRDGTWRYSWEHGRQLASMFDGKNTAWYFTYDASGMRTSRTDGTTTYSYVYNGGLLSKMTVGEHVLEFAYDASGTPMTVTLDGVIYYYLTNIQGDVVSIVDGNGTLVTHYTYDAWGRPLSSSVSTNSIAGLNPLRYRGYVYDQETELYYLQSRYYNPEIGRFLNADGYVATGQGLMGHNMFAYCGNNPVNRRDASGDLWVLAAIVIVACAVVLTGCSAEPDPPREDLAKADSLLDKSADELTETDKNSYNCYGNGIGKQINTDPTGYTEGDSTRDTFEAVKKDLGGDAYVRELDSIDAPIAEDEFRVAMKCGPTDYHFIRQLSDGTWYNKSGTTTGMLIPANAVEYGIFGDGKWYGLSVEYGISLPVYTYETIYFAVRMGWDA